MSQLEVSLEQKQDLFQKKIAEIKKLKNSGSNKTSILNHIQILDKEARDLVEEIMSLSDQLKVNQRYFKDD